MKIVFTSCMDAERVPDQPIWDRIRLVEHPDVLMLLGDQIYMDWGLVHTNWRRHIEDHKRHDKGLTAFAEDMHRRYALQWSVPQFQQLVCGFAGRADPSRLLVTWDDHDFAWNNSLGEDGNEAEYEHGVPRQVKELSRRLFGQFVQQLRSAPLATPYPPLPADWMSPLPPTPAPHLFWRGRLNSGAGPECLLLDTRWFRQARSVPASSVLGTSQRQQLLQALGQAGQGLLILAAGNPMAHKYLLSQQDWRGKAPDTPAYAEYAEATRAATQRPVLMLSGDIHRNAWSGRLNTPEGTPSQIAQILSSGAAIGRFGPKRFAPSYGVVTVTDTRAGEVKVDLRAMDKAGTWQAAPRMSPLPFTTHGWADDLQAEAMSSEDPAADDQPLALFMCRNRERVFTERREYEFPDLDGIDEVYRKGSLRSAELAEPAELLAHASAAGQTVQLKALGSPDGRIHRTAETLAAMERVFQRAQARGARSVVLFIHGFGKSPAEAAAQAYGLRACYPDCEPVLYAWEAGRAGGLLQALFGPEAAEESATVGVVALQTVLGDFSNVGLQYPNLARVVVARSAGSLALDATLAAGWPGAAAAALLPGVQRIVLSSPLLSVRAFNDNGRWAALETQVVVTCNRHDPTLHLVDLVPANGDILGVVGSRASGNICMLDFSDSARVGHLHDYLILKVNRDQYEINRRLLTEPTFDPTIAAEQGHLRADATAPGWWHVR